MVTLHFLWGFMCLETIIIIETYPGDKLYPIEWLDEDLWACYPKTEAELLELLWCYNGIKILAPRKGTILYRMEKDNEI